jgi:hypothetical protein
VIYLFSWIGSLILAIILYILLVHIPNVQHFLQMLVHFKTLTANQTHRLHMFPLHNKVLTSWQFTWQFQLIWSRTSCTHTVLQSLVLLATDTTHSHISQNVNFTKTHARTLPSTTHDCTLHHTQYTSSVLTAAASLCNQSGKFLITPKAK